MRALRAVEKETEDFHGFPEASSISARPKFGAAPAFLKEEEKPAEGGDREPADSAAVFVLPLPSPLAGRRHFRLALWAGGVTLALALALHFLPVTPKSRLDARRDAQVEMLPVPPKTEAGEAAGASQGQAYRPEPPDVAMQIISMPSPSLRSPEEKGTRDRMLSILSQ